MTQDDDTEDTGMISCSECGDKYFPNGDIAMCHNCGEYVCKNCEHTCRVEE